MFPPNGCFCVFALIDSTVIHTQALRSGAYHFEAVWHMATACKSVRLIPKMLLFCQISYSAGKHKPDEQHKLHSWGNSFFRLIFLNHNLEISFFLLIQCLKRKVFLMVIVWGIDFLPSSILDHFNLYSAY